ncbi:craniofacial development protein 2-like [Armigeres subalbatus]|uniref:craniofacial development protein 2-like n=1 Tax=Armigeres subalbatus TaxID=124917 RepID=UPI002ED6B199
MVRTFRGNHTIYQSCGNTHELGTAFIVMGDMQRRVIGWWPINERMCRLRIKGRFFNFSIINVHSPHSGSTDDDKDAFYAQLEREYDSCPSHDVKIIIGDLNAQVGQEEEFRPTIGKFSAHRLTNENGLRLIDFAASKNMAIRSTYFQHSLPYRYTWRSPLQTKSQIDHVLMSPLHTRSISRQRCRKRVSSMGPLLRTAGVQLKQPLTTQRRTTSGIWVEVDGTIGSTKSADRFWRRRTQRGRSRCSKVPGRTWNVIDGSGDSRPAFSGEETPPGRSGVRGDGTAVPFSRYTQVLSEAQRIPQRLCAASRNVPG